MSYDSKDLSEEMKKQYSAIDQVATAENVVESSSDISETSESVLHGVSSLNKLVKI